MYATEACIILYIPTELQLSKLIFKSEWYFLRQIEKCYLEEMKWTLD